MRFMAIPPVAWTFSGGWADTGRDHILRRIAAAFRGCTGRFRLRTGSADTGGPRRRTHRRFGACDYTVPNETHEFVAIRTDLYPLAVPTDPTGAVVEELTVGASQNLTLDLAAGEDVLIRNIYDEA